MPLHVLDNLTNLSDTAIAKTNLGLGTGDSPQFTNITTSGATISGSLNATDNVDFNGGVNFQTNFSSSIDLNAPTITSNATTVNLNATDIALNATNAITVGAPINSNITLNGNLTASGIVTSPDFSLTGTLGGELVASKSVAGWAFANTTTPALTSDTSPQAVFFKPDGSQVYVLGSGGPTTYRVYAHNVPTPWDVSTVSAAPNLSSVLIDPAMTGLYFSPDGRYFFTLTQNRVVKRFQMPIGSEWNVSTGVLSGSFTLGVSQTVNRGITFKPDGSKMYVYDDNTNFVYEYDLSPAWDLTAPSLATSALLRDAVSDITISSDGKRIIAMGVDAVIYEHTLPTPWSVTGIFFSARMPRGTSSLIFPNGGPAVVENTPTGIYYNDVLNKCFFVGSVVDRVQEIDVTPQPAIVGTRPLILSPVANSVPNRVTMNSLQITETGAAALFVNGGISLPDTAITWTGGATQRISGFSGRITFGSGATEWGRFNGAKLRVVEYHVGGVTDNGTVSFTSPSIGILTMTGVGGDFNRLQFGGITASFPAIKKATSGAGLEIVNAADTNFANLKANQITATGPIIFPSLPYITVITFTGAAYTGAMVFVSDEIGGACMAYYDGGDWRRIDNNTVIAPLP
jgi:hypothetical protein